MEFTKEKNPEISEDGCENAAFLLCNRTRDGLRQVLDFIRTAPFAYSLFALDASTGGFMLSTDYPYAVSINIIGGGLSIFLMQQQFKLRKRLEKSISRHGYNDRVFSKTTPTWCDRQVGMLVARNAGELDSYMDLCENNKGEL